MSNKLWALALLGGAAFLFRTKKGKEVRQQITDYTEKTVKQLKEKYRQPEALKGTMAS